MARPTGYSLEIAAELCSEIATRADGLDAICRSRKEFPTAAGVYLWLGKYPAFLEIYTRARAEQAQLLAEQIIEIADNTQLGEIVTIKPDGTEERKMADMLEHRKLRIESRKWIAAKLLPKKYGDKIQQEVTGKDGNALEVIVRRVGD